MQKQAEKTDVNVHTSSKKNFLKRFQKNLKRPNINERRQAMVSFALAILMMYAMVAIIALWGQRFFGPTTIASDPLPQSFQLSDQSYLIDQEVRPDPALFQSGNAGFIYVEDE